MGGAFRVLSPVRGFAVTFRVKPALTELRNAAGTRWEAELWCARLVSDCQRIGAPCKNIHSYLSSHDALPPRWEDEGLRVKCYWLGSGLLSTKQLRHPLTALRVDHCTELVHPCCHFLPRAKHWAPGTGASYCCCLPEATRFPPG